MNNSQRATAARDYTKYQIRVCKTLHFCGICKGRIEYGQRYYDGGYGKRAHDLCADADEMEKQAEKALAQANVEFYGEDVQDFNIGVYIDQD